MTNPNRARARKYGAYYESVKSLTIYERDNWICQLCGDSVDSTAKWPDQMCASLDHIVPISQQGPHSPANLRLAHWLCNCLRGVDDMDFMIAS